VPTPELFGQGEWSDGWTWLIMSRLPGQMLEEYWPTMSLENKADIMLRLGHLMAEVKQLPIEGLTFQQPDWESFIKAQLAAYRARHERHKMPAWFLQDVDHFVQKHLHLLPKHLRPVLLTGEYTPFNMLAIRRAGEVALSGMIDFGDAMIGYAPYDLLGPSLFLGEGHPVLIDRLFQGYGERPDLRLLMLLQILHRYSHFRVQLRIPDWEQRAANMNDLQNLIWPLS
jgi:hygromycin-B 7''-O-kinase